MKKRSVFFAVALAAVLAVATPATAVQEVVVGVVHAGRGLSTCPVAFIEVQVKLGTAEFQQALQAAVPFIASSRENHGCRGRISIRLAIPTE